MVIHKTTLFNSLKEGEGLFQEFKTSLTKIDRTMVSFANTQGGTIFLGVDDQGQISSFKLTNRIKAQIEDIAKNIDPSLVVDLIDLGKVAAIVVKEGEDKPYKCSDGFFIRVGATNQKLNRNQILELAVQFNRVRFETLQNTNFVYPKDFSKEEFVQFTKVSNLEEVAKNMGLEFFLISLGICEKQRGRLIFNHAGILFFAKNPQQFIPQAKINYTRYQGVTKSHIIDRVSYQGTLPEQLEAIYKRLTTDIPVAYKLAGEVTRKELSHYPMRALEEAIINSLIHRDYYEAGAEIMFDYYTDRIEISNPGGLIGGLTFEELENKTLRRNPLMAELFYRLGKGEKLGSGLTRMKTLMNEWKLKPPQFESGPNFFSVTFVGPKYKVSEEKQLTLPARPRQFVENQNLITEPFTTQQYAAMLEITQRTAQKDLEILLKKKVIKREGKGKNTRYRFL